MSSKKRNYDSDSDSDFSSKRKKLDNLLNQIMKIQEKLKKKEKKAKKERDRERERERDRAREKERDRARERECERERAREIVKERDRAREREREREREQERAREIVKERERELEMIEQDSEHLNNIAAYKCIINNMRIACPNSDSISKDIRHISRKYAVQTFKNCGICDERFDGFKFGAHTQLDGELLITKSNLVVCQTCVYSTAIKSFGGNFGIACKYLIKYLLSNIIKYY